jgi:hypothetical protein
LKSIVCAEAVKAAHNNAQTQNATLANFIVSSPF